MKRLEHKDILDIFNLFELELFHLRNIKRPEKIEIRKKLTDILNPALRAPIRHPDDIMKVVELKLYDIVARFRNKGEFLNKLSKTLDEKLMSPEESAVAGLKDFGPKMIRKKLDEIGLARSSVVRHILTRLSRESEDIVALRAGVNREAKKLKSSEEIASLLKIREENQLPFMKNIIDLLLKKIDIDQLH